MKRFGLFGGTFDPVHAAHLTLAHTALAALQLDELRWIPAGMPWQKSRALTPAEDRAAMVALAIQDEPRFMLDRCEIEREGPSYTLQTVRLLQATAQSGAPAAGEAVEWFLLLGQDQYANLHTWQGWPELIQRVTLAVAARDGQPVQASDVLKRVAHRMVTLPMPDSPISATALREQLAAGESAATLAPLWLTPAVARYIDQHGLYGADSAHHPHHEERT